MMVSFHYGQISPDSSEMVYWYFGILVRWYAGKT